MKKDIILSGVGGQGIISIASIIAEAALREGLYLKQAEVHGMSQRGGDVQSNLRISDKPVASDLIPKGKADLIISLEPLEALRYLPYLGPEGWIITGSEPFVNMDNYPEREALEARYAQMSNKILLDVDREAKDCGSPRAANIVLLGAASPWVGIPAARLEEVLRDFFSRKGEAVVETNRKAFRRGLEIAEKK